MPLLPKRLFLAILLCLAASACAPPLSESPRQSGIAHQVAPEFLRFWERYGGLSTFGPAIEAPLSDGPFLRQIFLNAELIYDPQSAEVSLVPLGWELGLAEPPIAPPDEGGRYFASTGHTLFPGFSQAYEELGGASVVGAPISEIQVRDGRIEQHFENLGFYREESADPTAVKLMAFGLAKRSRRGEIRPGEFSAALAPEVRSRPFGLFLDTWGGEVVFGRPLTEPYLAPDGAVEQVYERAVLYSPASDPAQVGLRPLGLAAGPPAPPVERANDPDGLYFPETGHNVRWAFADFYRSNGGEPVFGLPVEELSMRDGSLTQRFENAILIYRFDLPSNLAVQLSPLGMEYQIGRETPTPALPQPTPSPLARPEAPGRNAQITTNLERRVLPPGSPQRIEVRVLLPGGEPWSGAVPVIAVRGPRSELFLNAPATDSQGRSMLTLSLADLRPGEIVTLEVAVASETGLGYAVDQFIGGTGGP